MANIEKRVASDGDVTFRVKVRLRGHPTETATFSRLTDARLWIQKTEAAIREGRHFKTAEAKRHTLAELIDRYIKEILPRKASKSKFSTNQSQQLNWWKAQLGPYVLSDITPARIVEARGRLGRSPATANRYMAALSHVFTIAIREWEWIEDSPIRKISKLKEPRGRVRYLSDEERTKLIEAARNIEDPTLYTVIVLALSTGARQGELLNLNWKDVDFKRGSLTFHETKNGERRTVPLTGLAHDLLKERHSKRDKVTSLVFPSEESTPVRVDRPFQALLAQTDIQDFRFHDLRHSAASYLAMNGASLAEIAEVLGHKTLQMVKRYAHLSEAHTSKVVASMNAKIFGND